MTSKRRLRRKKCGSKRRFAEAGPAIAVAIALRKQQSGRVDAYWCEFCNGYHVGHPPNKNAGPLWRPARKRKKTMQSGNS